jgi:hypothetical protein
MNHGLIHASTVFYIIGGVEYKTEILLKGDLLDVDKISFMIGLTYFSIYTELDVWIEYTVNGGLPKALSMNQSVFEAVQKFTNKNSA